MIPDRLRDLILAIGAMPGDAIRDRLEVYRAAWNRLAPSDRADLMQFMRDHYVDDRAEHLAAALADMPHGLGEAFDRLSEADQDRVWALFIRTIHPPGHWSVAEMSGRTDPV